MKDFEPKIMVFCCNWCSYAGADPSVANGFIDEVTPELGVLTLNKVVS
jgi:coenzyme F420-reducing hydrogenase delta subunit